jgi:hypothetical protein
LDGRAVTRIESLVSGVHCELVSKKHRDAERLQSLAQCLTVLYSSLSRLVASREVFRSLTPAQHAFHRIDACAVPRSSKEAGRLV